VSPRETLLEARIQMADLEHVPDVLYLTAEA
jgi:hypothetical protein